MPRGSFEFDNEDSAPLSPGEFDIFAEYLNDEEAEIFASLAAQFPEPKSVEIDSKDKARPLAAEIEWGRPGDEPV